MTAPFLLPEMVDRLASMLNYFLKYLTGSERRRLAIKDPEKFSFKPRELLLSIIQARSGRRASLTGEIGDPGYSSSGGQVHALALASPRVRCLPYALIALSPACPDRLVSRMP